MLRITQQAATLLRQAQADAGAPDGSGVRFFAEAKPSGTTLAVDFAARPAEDDQVSTQEGLPVYVAADMAEPLKEAVIDAKPMNGAPRLVIDTSRPSAP